MIFLLKTLFFAGQSRGAFLFPKEYAACHLGKRFFCSWIVFWQAFPENDVPKKISFAFLRQEDSASPVAQKKEKRILSGMEQAYEKSFKRICSS